MTEHEDDEDVQEPPSFTLHIKALGARIRDVRRAREMTQEQLADGAGIQRPHVSDIERGVKQLSVDTLYRLARALRVHPAELLDDRDEGALLVRIRKERKNSP